MLEYVDLDNFDLLVKLHTKRDMHELHRMKEVWTPGPLWREMLLAFCSTQENWKQTKQRFLSPNIGMVSHELNRYLQEHDSCQFHYTELKNLGAHESWNADAGTFCGRIHVCCSPSTF